MIPSRTVWEMRGRGDNQYRVYGGVWRNAHDGRHPRMKPISDAASSEGEKW